MHRTESQEFLKTCTFETQAICLLTLLQGIDNGRVLNPYSFGYPGRWDGLEPLTQESYNAILLDGTSLSSANLFSNSHLFGQSTVAFLTREEFEEEASRTNLIGKKEYGVQNTDWSAVVANKATELYDGIRTERGGAVTFPSGAAAINSVLGGLVGNILDQNPDQKLAIFMPEGAYFPARRYVNRKMRGCKIFEYQGSDLDSAIEAANHEGYQPGLVHIEPIVSNSFEKCKVRELTRRAARDLKVFSVVDNSHSSPIGYNPKSDGADIVLDAWTKVAGWGDLPFGVAVGYSEEAINLVSDDARVEARTTIAPGACQLMLHRLETTEARMDRSWKSAQHLLDTVFRPMLGKEVEAIYVFEPGKDTTTGPQRSTGIFTIQFNPEIPREVIRNFLNGLHTFFSGESYATNNNLINETTVGGRPAVRFSIGLANQYDIQRDLQQSRQKAGLRL